MINYRQWHEEENGSVSFFSEGQVYFCQCDLNHKLSLFELLRIVTDAAVEDFNQRNMSYNILTQNNFGILVSRQSFRFHQMPAGDQKITIKTWEEKPEPLQFVRAYEIFDSQTKLPLVSGISTWLLVDLNKRRIMRTKDFPLRKEPDITTIHNCLDAGKITISSDTKILGKRQIYFSDIDGNGHMNNARYGSFVMDFLPSEYQNKSWSDFRINYNKEAVLGEMIELYGTFCDESKKISMIGKQGQNICFEAELFYC